MSLSFKDSLKANIENNVATTKHEIIEPVVAMNIDDMSVDNIGIMTLDEDYGIVAYSGDSGNWQQHHNYVYYSVFSDDNISIVNDNKDITLSDKQFNITQEENSQYIPFEMPRYYDGFDLVNTVISIHYTTKNGRHGSSKPINVTYNNEKIRFGWLVDANATIDVGALEFEIHAYGTVIGSDGIAKAYTWKTKRNKNLNVLESLCDCEDVVNNIDDSWVQELVTDIAEKVASQIAEADVEEQVIRAENAATRAETARDNAESIARTTVTNALNDYSTTSEMQSYVATEIANADIDNKLTAYAKIDNVNALIGELGDKESVVSYVNDAIENVDVSEDLKNYALIEDVYTKTDSDAKLMATLTEGEYATKTDVANAIAAEDITNKLGNYYTKDETYSKTEIDNAIENVEVDLTDYATEKFVTDKTDILSSSVDTNTKNISSLSETIGELQESVGSIDTSPRLTYDVVYNDAENPEIGENGFGFYEIQNEGKENEVRELKKKFTIVGGSGGGSSSVLKIAYVTKSPVITTVNDKVLITYNFSGTDSSGDIITEANYTWKIGSKIIASGIATDGENTFDATDFATTTSQKFTLTITDEGGSLVTKTWNVQKVDVRLESNFNDAYKYDGDVPVNYTAYGAIEKDIHFVLDGKELESVTTSTSGIPSSYIIPKQTHGSHLLDMYITTTINNIPIESNHEYKDITWCDPTSSIPVIGCATPVINVVQHNTVNIKYSVHDPNTETPEVTWYIDGEVASVEKLTEKDAYGYYTYSYKANNHGTFVFTITCGDAEPKVITMNVEKLNINVSPVTAGLEFDFNPVGYSNSSSDRLWSYNDVAMTVSDNFDWVNGGYQIDENGDKYFCVKAGTNAVINYNLFADDPKKSGKEFKIVFRTKNIRKRDTSFLSCMNDGIGLDMKVEHATVYDSAGLLKSNYCEDTIIEYEFNINKDTDMMIVMSYEDGAPSKPYEYKETSSFKQSFPKPIVIGSKDCDVYIYRIKAYSNSLTDTDIKNNFIADARNADEMIARYTKNQIYNENGGLVSTSASGDFNVDALMKAAPDLRYIFLEVPQFTNDKDNKIDGCTVYFRYPNGTRPQDNWTCTGVRHRGQGTSSNLYGYSGRNIDLCMDRDESLFTYTDEEGNTVESSTITLTDTSYPTDYLNIKVNIASSENENNARLARRFNEYQPFLRYARKKDSRIKDTMEFHNCVVFIRETSTDPSVPHREFNDTNWHFYAIGNVGDSKKTDDTRVNNKRDPKEHIIEITDADKPLSAFPTGKDGHAVCPIAEWKSGNTAYDVLYSNEYVYDEEGAFESFGGKTYEFRYEMKDITDEQRQANIDTWRDLYTFIVTSTDEEFYANLKNYFVVDSALYYYLFTERYTMVDNRAKNSFWHYGKVYISNEEAVVLGESEARYYIIDDEMAAINDGYRYDLTFGYDMDTALGIDNTGDYVFSYGKEDTDYYIDGDPTSDYVFRVADSVFFCRLRDLFPSEMQAMFKNREEKNAWDSNSLITEWDNAQAQFPEELWRLDYERKYYRTYLGLSIDNSISQGVDKTFLIGKFFGRKKYARRAFEINQEMYFATKYFGNKALSDVFWIRGNVPIGSSIKPNYSLTLVPYSDMYVCVQYTSTGTPIHKKVKAGQTVYFENDAERMDFVYVYAASYIQEVGDLSRCFVGDNNFSSAIRLQKLEIGSTDDGYENTFMKEVLVGNNPLLEYLDLRNISGINTVIDVSGCSNLKELYAEGTNASGVIFANGGLLETAHLPNTLVSLSMKNLNYIEDFIVGGYDNLQTLIVENVPTINTYDIVNSSPSLKLVRLINLNWNVDNSSILSRLYNIDGIDSSGYETDQSVLSGTVSVPTIGQYELYKYQEAWSDLTIVPKDGVIPQYKVTFRNYDGTVLKRPDGTDEIQYIDQYGDAINPYTREENRIIPTRESSVQYDYSFIDWDKSFTNVVADIDVYATYEESLRDYTIQYVSMGVPVKTTTGKYGDYIGCDVTPTYTAAEPTAFYLFNRWDKSGFLTDGFDSNGVKTVTAIFDKFDGNSNYFRDKEFSDLSPVEIYALTKLGLDNVPHNIQIADPYSFTMGYDVDYDDIESNVIISEKTSFNGTNYMDTEIKLFDEDRDFVLALDYVISSNNNEDGTFMQCFQSSGSNGFKLGYGSNNPNFIWGSSSITPSSSDNREMLIIRHKKGDNNLYVYTSNLDSTESLSYILNKSAITSSDTATLIFGAGKMDSGRITNYCTGDVYWCKIWYKDLGEEVCKKLVGWTHEEITLGVSGFYRYPLYDDRTRETMISFVASHLLDRTMKYNNSSPNTNAGGWAKSDLNKILNTRFYNAIPTQIKSLLKKMCVLSTIGQKSSEVSESGCYVNIPSVYDVDKSKTDYKVELYAGASTIESMATQQSRRREFRYGFNNDNIDAYESYWLRSPEFTESYSTNYYVWCVNENYQTDTNKGTLSSVNTPSSERGVLIEISF